MNTQNLESKRAALKSFLFLNAVREERESRQRGEALRALQEVRVERRVYGDLGVLVEEVERQRDAAAFKEDMLQQLAALEQKLVIARQLVEQLPD